MSADTAIRIEGLGKRYRIDHQVRHDTLRDALSHGAKGLLRALRLRRAENRAAHEDFWALRDVSFDVQRGEVIGVIGRNGAGKSTLLKILSRITEPTTGRIELRGRVASLLEVGTGFHPELTGRENIFLNGSILGMSRAEIQSKFDEIVAFAEVEKFLDTPVKRYSSGMYVRLAFAVAAHLEPEILIVDEVLAVGDAAFQKKCLGKMRDIATDAGRTVLFVSHNMGAIQSLCMRSLVLQQGRLSYAGPTGEAVSRYLDGSTRPGWRRDRPLAPKWSIVEAGATVEQHGAEAWVQIDTLLEGHVALTAAFEVFLCDASGFPLAMGGLGNMSGAPPLQLMAGKQRLYCRFPVGRMANGHYVVSLKLVIPFRETLDEAQHVLSFDLELGPPPGATHRLLQAWGSGSFLLDLVRVA